MMMIVLRLSGLSASIDQQFLQLHPVVWCDQSLPPFRPAVCCTSCRKVSGAVVSLFEDNAAHRMAAHRVQRQAGDGCQDETSKTNLLILYLHRLQALCSKLD